MRVETHSEPALPELTLTGEGLRLRAFTSADLDLIEAASADPYIPTVTSVPEVFSAVQGEAFIERQVHRRVSGEGWSLAIVVADSERSIGQIGLWVANLQKGRAELGYWIEPSYRGSGAACRALMLMGDWAFANLDVSRLSLFIEPWNTASIKTAERAGFQQEGLLANWERVEGVAKDMYSFVRCAPVCDCSGERWPQDSEC